MLSTADLDKLPRYYSRSPYSNEVRTQVFLRSDVEKLALEKHGGKEAFEKRRKLVKDLERKATIEAVERFARRRLNKDATQSYKSEPGIHGSSMVTTNSWRVGPGKVVMMAIIINGLNVVAKAMAWWYTGSKSMFSEMMHSIADTLNQVILAYGLRSSLQQPDVDHPYGYSRMRCISSLISGVGIFFLGSGFTFYHALQGMVMPLGLEYTSMYGAIGVALGSLITEGSTLLVAYKEVRRKTKENGFESIQAYLLSGTADPSTAVVLLEDSAAVLGVLVAGAALSASVLTGTAWPDTLGGVAISGILAVVAGFIIRTNSDILIGKSISLERQERIMRFIDNAKIIRGTYDTKAMLMGGDNAIRLKAEVDIDGRELTRRYLETMPLGTLLAEIQAIKTEEQLIHFMLDHGDQLVNTLGAEINQIEDSLKKEFPDIKHIDIEIN
ncbi:zinc transporter 9 [Echinococcus multilocularis]|uniref:Proton-coupled zinc antiporter SLC30A9, mitochondrial n=1 Tax=Echinococcus multilocularis TaxID=6211 RepID=A0A068Y4N8_ECHMU|nr:zinc transporter 9 [Echinococcus multilocularis]